MIIKLERTKGWQCVTQQKELENITLPCKKERHRTNNGLSVIMGFNLILLKKINFLFNRLVIY